MACEHIPSLPANLECFNIVGISNNQCECLDLPPDSETPLSDIYLTDELQSILPHLINNMQCGDELFCQLVAARNAAIRRVYQDLQIAIRTRYKSAQNENATKGTTGVVGLDILSYPFTTDLAYYGVHIHTKNIAGGKFALYRIGMTPFYYEGAAVNVVKQIAIYNKQGDLLFNTALFVDKTALMGSWFTLPEALCLDMYAGGNCGADYYVVTDQLAELSDSFGQGLGIMVEAFPLQNNEHCGCINNTPTWLNKIRFDSFANSEVNFYQLATTDNLLCGSNCNGLLNGFLFDIGSCIIDCMLCELLTYENKSTPFFYATAQAIKWAAVAAMYEYLSRTTTITFKQLAGGIKAEEIYAAAQAEYSRIIRGANYDAKAKRYDMPPIVELIGWEIDAGCFGCDTVAKASPTVTFKTNFGRGR